MSSSGLVPPMDLRPFVNFLLVGAIVLTGAAIWYEKRSAMSDGKIQKINMRSGEESRFKWVYLGAYLLAMFADWLQGPYVYALYAAYGFPKSDNALLFVVGFGSSMLFGTVVGSWADKMGRKKAALFYCAVYAINCASKHFNNFFILACGRLLAGIATSLLFSVFEAWLVCQHGKSGLSEKVLGDTFSTAIFGNGLCAIFAGFAAQAGSDMMEMTNLFGSFHIGGFVIPFDMSAMVLGACALFITLFWAENYGEADNNVGENERPQLSPSSRFSRESVYSWESTKSAFVEALNVLKTDTNVLRVGTVISFFEASMFIFVFLWTPAITQDPRVVDAPYGLIFALFMAGCMLGSSIFSVLTTTFGVSGQNILVFLNIVSGICHSVPMMTTDPRSIIMALVLFELAVGMYFPAMGMMKGRVVPEFCRSTMYNVFRVPLNFIVVAALVLNVSVSFGFMVTSGLLFTSAVLATGIIDSPREVGDEQSENELEMGDVPVGVKADNIQIAE